MKQFIFLVILLGAGLTVQAQSVSKLSVMKAIKNDFPKSEDIEISSRCGSYEATFFQNNEPIKACYDRNGELQMTTYLIEEGKLPKVSRNFIETNFSTLSISEILKKESEQDKIEYTVRFEDGSRLYFDEAGERINMYSNCKNTNINN